MNLMCTLVTKERKIEEEWGADWLKEKHHHMALGNNGFVAFYNTIQFKLSNSLSEKCASSSFWMCLIIKKANNNFRRLSNEATNKFVLCMMGSYK